jgi:mono/diheme cytochrome c family protein
MRVLGALGFCGIAFLLIFDQNKPEVHANILDHFKYGSIGAEERAGVPFQVWRVLPRLFPQYLPNRPGNGYERFGLIFESAGAARPIGTSYRERQVGLVGLNCAVCHTGVLRDAPGAPRQIVPGMPAHQLDLQSYERFIFACAKDPGFTTDRILQAIRETDPKFSWFDGVIWRLLVLPRTKDGMLREGRNFAWFDQRPAQGPGRVDTFNPYKVIFGFDMRADSSVGTTDLPSLWNQRVREGLWLHWDGNNNLVTERNKSAAIGAGASEDSLDLPAMKRIEDWILDLKPPAFPVGRIKSARVSFGKALYEKQCASCHDLGSKMVGQTVDAATIGTDSERVNSFTAALTEKMNTLGTGRPWKFSHFRKTNGYASMPLDGIWLRAPYLHNGSVPTLRDLLKPPEERPAVFWRGYDVYDYDNVGFVSSGADAERAGFRYDTGARGNSRQGHTYGTDLKPAEKDDLLEYLKTL